MLIDGKLLAESILTKLADTVTTLKKGGITPTLAVILVGNDIGSLSYIKQKQKAADRVGINVIFEHMPETTSRQTLESAIAHYNNDHAVHGLIVQRPVPIEGLGGTLNTVASAKDVDGFVPHSPFEVPVARATITILEHIHTQVTEAGLIRQDFKAWLTRQNIAVIGRGETAGKPIADLLIKYGCMLTVIHSQTPKPEIALKNAHIIISCVGKKNVITKSMIEKGAMLVAVGLWRDSDGKLHGDYETTDIETTASFYTPTPGGVGPVNVACLMHNVIDACIMNIETSKS